MFVASLKHISTTRNETKKMKILNTESLTLQNELLLDIFIQLATEWNIFWMFNCWIQENWSKSSRTAGLVLPALISDMSCKAKTTLAKNGAEGESDNQWRRWRRLKMKRENCARTKVRVGGRANTFTHPGVIFNRKLRSD